ncbi:MAG TPA: DUF6580 family putative transport protein, partial [Pseudolabrys sp.]|nr:DUF6580 family putative transport protein [Pseudolabrys sp.]
MMTDKSRAASPLWTDFALVAFLIAFDAVARLLPHAPGFLPVAASALFAGRMLRLPGLAIVVPVAAMALSSPLLGAEDWRILAVVYAAIAVPALAGMWLRKRPGATMTAAAMV